MKKKKATNWYELKRTRWREFVVFVAKYISYKSAMDAKTKNHTNTYVTVSVFHHYIKKTAAE